MTVLKGSAATALYGSRATNGVILITTKKGISGRKLNVDISSHIVWDKPAYLLKFQNEYGGGFNGSEYIWKRDHPEMSYQDYAKQYAYNWVDGNGAGVNDANPVNWGPRLDAGLLLDQWSTGPNSPWVSRPDNMKDFFQTGTTIEHSAAVSAHGEKAAGRVGFTRSDVSGILWNTNQTTNTLSTSLTLTPTNRLTANVNVTYLDRESTIPPAGYSGAMIDFGWVQRDLDTKYMKEQFDKMGNKGFISPFLDNYYYKLTNTNTLKRDRTYGGLDVNFKITDWLSATGRVGTDFYNEYRKSITHAGTASNVLSNKGGQFSQVQLYNKETNADFILNFDKKISDFRIDGLVGTNYRDVQYKSMGLSAGDLTVPDVFAISNVKGTPGVSNYDSEKKTNSIYASANISYLDYLFLGITGRNDWSSTLPAANRSYFYPSVSLGFIFTDALNIHSDALSFGKIRASWANVGGDTDPYRLSKTYAASTFAGVSMFSLTSTLPPLNLKPQETKSIEAGADLKFLKNRIELDITYYDQKTINQILSVPISRTTGYSAQLINAGEIENRGVELILTANIIDNPSALSWNVAVNWSKNKNMVNELYGGLTSYSIASGPGGITTLGVPGQQWGALYSLGYVRDDKGNIKVDESGIPITSNSAMLLGNTTPKWTGGIQNTFRYKKLQLGFLVDARWGSQFFSTTLWHGYYTGTAPETVKNNVRETGLIVDGVKPDGSKNDIRISAQEFYGGSWMWNNLEYPILNGTFVKLRELSLTYPVNVSKLKWINSLSISLIGRNLAILYRDKRVAENGIDPETGFGGGDSGVGWEDYQLPTTRSFGLKINASF
jgi:TonB-linked SusC/RagA family outer membrane protein